MRRLIRWAVPLGLLLTVLEQSGAIAATTNVSIVSFAFNPTPVTVTLGDSIQWKNNATITHGSTSDATNPNGSAGLSWWDSGFLAPAATFTFAFTAAGTFTYHCPVHPTTMMGTVDVAPIVTPASAPLGTTFTLHWATVTAPTGFVYDVQYLAPGSTTWKLLRAGTTASGGSGMIPAKGTWQFRSRLRRTSPTSGASGFSPPAVATVT